MNISESAQIANEVRALIPEPDGLSLKIWGNWFGKPYDNNHKIIACKEDADIIRIQFDMAEVLTVWSPRGRKIDKSTFFIRGAARVRWEWFYYGRPQTPENRYFEDFKRANGIVTAETNVDWADLKLKPDLSQVAIELLRSV